MIGPWISAAAALLVAYWLRSLYQKRYERFSGIPQLPTSYVWGNLITIDAYTKKLPPKAHIDMAFAAMHEALGRPPAMVIDLWPINSPMIMIGDHKVAEQVIASTEAWPYGLPKVAEFWKGLELLIGPKSMVSINGHEWKSLRRRFNPGFSSQNLMEMLPLILDKVDLFVRRLDRIADTKEEFSLQEYSTDLTFDIIGRVAVDMDMDAQTPNPTEFMQLFHSLIGTYHGPDALDLPWWFSPRTEWKRQRLSKEVRRRLRAMVYTRHAQDQKASNASILSMSLRGIDKLDPALVDVTCDQLLGFLFAGHDTTSTLMSWTIYELSRTPHALRAVRAELDDLFGSDPDPAAVRKVLLSPTGPTLIHRMTYTMAVLKETLRLWPPASASRMSRPGDNFVIQTPNGPINTDGYMVYQVHSIIQRDPNMFGESANHFVPERWLNIKDDDDDDDAGGSSLPPGAWRAFERGPRNCIGQELALIEARVMIALVVRRFDFTKIGIGSTALTTDGEPEMDEFGQHKTTSEMYMVS